MAMKSPVRLRRMWILVGLAVAASSLGCGEFDRTRLKAHLGDRGAQVLVGHAYETGEDVPQDLAAAADWFRRAAEQGQPQAFARLGKLYALGAGVPRDLAQAHTWFELGYRRGQLRFAIYAKKLEFDLSAQEIAESLERADAWDASH
jgi:hypothetical protein